MQMNAPNGKALQVQKQMNGRGKSGGFPGTLTKIDVCSNKYVSKS
jgi:hypothetical protein